MLQLVRAIVSVASDVLRLVVSFLRLSSAIRAENPVLRRQLARYIERGIRPRRMDHATRVSLALFSRHVGCRTAMALRDAGFDARYMTVGHSGWKAVGAPVKMNA